MDERARFQLIEELFREACNVQKDQREAFLSSRCGDEAIVREVLSLLEEDTSPLIDDAAGVSGAMEMLASAGTPGAPEVEGFNVIRLIGEGGMGLVYEAEQLRPQRRVALKVVRAGMVSPERLRRFQLESEFLGRLRHPGVAQIFGVGAAADGRPYFAMELVEGEPITAHVRGRSLGVGQRVELFLDVCDGVMHAHQQGVIHRDLKPGNILVEPDGGAKILDFGIARASGDDNQATVHTIEGQVVGTLAYMSPEQAAGDPSAIDTRTDVYSLGVLLFELLADRRPHELDGLSLDEAIRVVRTGEATRLGTVDRRLRGDLETIALKALEKDPARRYQSVAELAADLRRYLRDEPVVARPPSTIYQLRKFARRNKAFVIGAGAVAAAVVAGLVGTLIALDRAIDAERLAEARLEQAEAALERADQQASIALAAKEFLTDDLLNAASPDQQGPSVPVGEILRAASDRIGQRTDMDPLFRSEILVTLGKTLAIAGEFERSREHLQEAIDIREELLGPDDLLTVDAVKELGSAHVLNSQVEPDRVARAKRVLDVRIRELGKEHDQTIVAMNDYAIALDDDGRIDDALPIFDEAIELARATLGPDSTKEATLLHNLAWSIEHRDPERAEQAFRDCHRIRLKRLGPRHTRTLLAANSLASALWAKNELEEAEQLYIETLAARREVLGELHMHTINTLDNLGTIYIKTEEWDKAMEHTGRALELRIEAFGRDDYRTARTMNNVGAIYRGMKDYVRAEELFREAYETLAAEKGREADAAWLLKNHAQMLWELDRRDEAEAALLKSLDMASQLFEDKHPRVKLVLEQLVGYYDELGRTDDALALRERLGESDPGPYRSR